jgi:RNA polymerase sigma-70 factor (ECF subfamily)
MSDTSISLLERAASRTDGAAWHRLAEIYTPLLQDWLRQQGLPPTDADDVVQEVLLYVSQELPAFEHNGHSGAFRSWLRQVLVFRLRKHWEKSKRGPAASGRSDYLEQLQQLEDPTSGLSRLWDREHDRHVAAALIALVRERMSGQSCVVLERVVIAGEPPADVARDLGMTVNAVYAARFRILQLLRREGQGLLDSAFGLRRGKIADGRESA